MGRIGNFARLKFRKSNPPNVIICEISISRGYRRTTVARHYCSHSKSFISRVRVVYNLSFRIQVEKNLVGEGSEVGIFFHILRHGILNVLVFQVWVYLPFVSFVIKVSHFAGIFVERKYSFQICCFFKTLAMKECLVNFNAQNLVFEFRHASIREKNLLNECCLHEDFYKIHWESSRRAKSP